MHFVVASCLALSRQTASKIVIPCRSVFPAALASLANGGGESFIEMNKRPAGDDLSSNLPTNAAELPMANSAWRSRARGALHRHIRRAAWS
jgi:hypothetical protein